MTNTPTMTDEELLELAEKAEGESPESPQMDALVIACTTARIKSLLLDRKADKSRIAELARERDAYRTTLIEAGRAGGAFLTDQVSREFLEGVPMQIAGLVNALRSRAETAEAALTELRERVLGVVERYDDGSQVELGSYSGGAAKEGAWGAMSLIFRAPDGSSQVRRYVATGPQQDWDAQPADLKGAGGVKFIARIVMSAVALALMGLSGATALTLLMIDSRWDTFADKFLSLVRVGVGFGFGGLAFCCLVIAGSALVSDDFPDFKDPSK